MSITRSDVFAWQDGKYSLWYKGRESGGALAAAGEMDTLLEAQTEKARWEAARPEWTVNIVRRGKFVVIDEERGEVL